MRSIVTPELVDIFTKLGDKILQISNYKLKLNIFNVARLRAELGLGSNVVKGESQE